MIFGFALIIYAGPLALMLVVSSQSDSQIRSVLDHNFPTDFGSASKMLCRNNQHRVCCVQNSWLTLVSVSLLVFPDYLQLLFLWRELGRLLWSGWQPNGKILFTIWQQDSWCDCSYFHQEFLRALVKYHRFISFSLYIGGFVWFVLSLVKRYYMKQFSLFAWTHVALLIVVTQSYLIIRNIFQGLIWFV